MELNNPTKQEMALGYFFMGCHENHVHVFRAEVLRRLEDGYKGELCNGILVVDKRKIKAA